MKKIVTGVAATLAVSFAMNAAAVDRIGFQARERLERETAEMTENLSLSAEQSEKMLEIKSVLFASNRDARNEHGAGSAEFNEARKQNMRAFQKDLQDTLTEDQLKKHRSSRS
ncbi:hypothetical protein GZ77_20275 [Endozoicomonas montiporae]|uniref:Uncharacterized protein n=2 Tax=Endozoicomonas montiporae TaxID=1027273 RepID=A0A081N2X4_9GAMM|nr:hypothetical protein [Endozoicomonas montiporae]AMO58063.1 hypothetical protein EZMO1_4138 [Endozoicomonas montiporae CL-33]KEQ12797.1 hypothetical protein GZ77_20275 [Endozoicomonas montiporae]